MKLYPLNPSRLHFVEVGQFIVRFLTDLRNTGIITTTDAEFDALCQSLITQSPIYNDALVQIKAKAESLVLAELDDKRDKKIVTIRRLVSVYEFTDVAAEATAYSHLKIVLNNFDGLEKANFEAETLGIDNLIKELRTPINLPFVQLLGVDKHVTNLETAATNFKTTFDKRSTDTVSTVVYDTKLLRTNLIDTYKNLADYVLVMAKNKKNTDYYTNILAVLNNGRQYFADILARREGVAAAATPTPPAAG